MSLYFDQLVSAFANAVVDAQHSIKKAYLGDLSRFFNETKEKKNETLEESKTDELGSLIMTNIKIPRFNPKTCTQEYHDVSVPLITLVNHNQLSIQEMQITMKVDINEVLDNSHINKEQDFEQKYELKQSEKRIRLNSSTLATGKKEGDVGFAQITLKITAENQAEGMARLLDQLNKCL